jgi:hypothetical protein
MDIARLRRGAHCHHRRRPGSHHRAGQQRKGSGRIDQRTVGLRWYRSGERLQDRGGGLDIEPTAGGGVGATVTLTDVALAGGLSISYCNKPYRIMTSFL